VKIVRLLDLLISLDRRVTRKEYYSRILCGEIYVDGQCVRDAARQVPDEAQIEYRPLRRFVSRGGEKLADVLQRWSINVRGLGFIDAGASTGGFTDCLLQHGAARVIAVEVGRNQLDYRLRSDSRVIVYEDTNIMSLGTLPFVPDAAVADLSLRSLRKAAARLLDLISGPWIITLVKPQYEKHILGEAGESGTSWREHIPIILETLFLDLREEGVFASRIAAAQPRGRKGNPEFFALLTAEEDPMHADLKSMIAKAASQDS